MIKIENLVHKYTIWKDENTKSEKTVLDGISLDIPSGQFVAILGPNGSGKSTLARHLNVLLLPDEGKVWIDGKDTQAKERLYEIRSRVGMVFQNPDNQIIGTSVEEDVAFGPENKNVEPEKIRKIVEDVLRKVRLWEKRKTPPSKLSGGQKQRLATADALAGIRNVWCWMNRQLCWIPLQEKSNKYCERIESKRGNDDYPDHTSYG